MALFSQPPARPAEPSRHPTKRSPCSSTRDLNGAERSLLQLIQRIGFGRIEHVRVIQGKPDLSELRVVRDIRLGGPVAEHPQPSGAFSLKQEVRDFFTVLRKLEAAIIRKVEVRHGPPVHLQIEDLAGASGDGQ